MTSVKSVQRNRVIWLGESPNEEVISEFNRRWLLLYPTTSIPEDPTLFNLSRAIVIPFKDKISTPRVVRHLVSDNSAFNFGLMIFVHIPKKDYEKNYPSFATIVEKYPERIKIVMDYGESAQEIFQHNPGPSANYGLVINGTKNLELVLLLQRAFWNCESITLVTLTGGLTSEVYRADVIQSGDAGPSPLPFFIKFDILKRILRENNNYTKYVEGYLPFNHRPNLIKERCILGAHKALLVGNFVEHSESLGTVANRGTFTPAIYSLFHQALRSWHGQAIRDPQIYHAKNKELSMKESLLQDNPNWPMFPNVSVEPTVWEEAQTQGCEHNPQQLIEKIAAWPKILQYRGPIHRDLHTQNVQVRGADAIIFDFYNTSLGPLLWDPATLEVSLSLLLMARTHSEQGTIEQWRDLMLQLYQQDVIRQPLNIVECPSSLEGIWSCIRETRFYALGLEIEQGTYRQALGIQLLRQSLRKISAELPANWEVYKRALTYKLAEQIITTVGGT